MHKTISPWSVKTLSEQFQQIEFPEYQREPNLWSLAEKRRLIDSMIRQFDIASLYFYQHENGVLDCVDGRQRIGTIMAFLGVNPEDPDNKFELRLSNEFSDDEHPAEISEFDRKTFDEIRKTGEKGDLQANSFVDQLLNYQLSVVELSGSRAPEEFNLQFTRLNLGTILNSGERLNAMVGEMRDECFKVGGLGKHPFLDATNIPTRRFAREQVATQILAQVFSLHETADYRRTRHFDLQNFFKQHRSLDEEPQALIKQVHDLLDLLDAPFHESTVLKNRAMTVSTVLLAWNVQVGDQAQAERLRDFIEEFQLRLTWQIKKGLDMDHEYRHLVDFQRQVTQASSEKPAYARRASRLEEDYALWSNRGELTGDAEWKDTHPGRDPGQDSRGASA